MELTITPGVPAGYAALSEVVGDYPDEGEPLAEITGVDDWETVRYGIVEIDPVEWFENYLVDGAQTLREVFEQHAEPWQRKLVRGYRRLAVKEAKDWILVIDSNDPRLLHGFHRMVAMALEGITSVRAVDLALKEDEEGSVS